MGRGRELQEVWQGRQTDADIPIKPDIIGKLADGAKRVAEGGSTGKPEEFHGQKIVAYDLGFTVLLCDE